MTTKSKDTPMKTFQPGGLLYRITYALLYVPVGIGQLIDRLVGYRPMNDESSPSETNQRRAR